MSIITPVYNEAQNLPEFFSHIKKVGPCEVLCIDGGSRDASLKLLKSWAEASDAKQRHVVLSSAKGRGQQMNAGALQAQGEIFIFLHADSCLPLNAIPLVQQAMKNPEVAGGSFHLRIDSGHWFLKWISLMANLRSKYGGLPYGDQAYFVRKNVFEGMGGYRPLSLMEDVDFFRRLQKEGKTVLLKEAVSTSDRKWRKKGIYINSIRNTVFICLYFLGVSPGRLAKWYDPS